MVNSTRVQAGLGSLQARADVTEIALAHSRNMAAEGRLYHNDGYFSKANSKLLGAMSRGENVALNSSIADAHRRLLESPGHRANLLNPRFSVAGIAVVQTDDGRYWVTQNFLQPVTVRPERAMAASGRARRAPRPKATVRTRPRQARRR